MVSLVFLVTLAYSSNPCGCMDESPTLNQSPIFLTNFLKFGILWDLSYIAAHTLETQIADQNVFFLNINKVHGSLVSEREREILLLAFDMLTLRTICF